MKTMNQIANNLEECGYDGSDDNESKDSDTIERLSIPRMHTSNIEKNSMKVFHKRVTWKMLVTAAQYVHYQCCTSCLRQLYMQDLLHPLTNVNHQTRVVSGQTTEQWIT